MKLRWYFGVVFAALLLVGGYLLGASIARESFDDVVEGEVVNNLSLQQIFPTEQSIGENEVIRKESIDGMDTAGSSSINSSESESLGSEIELLSL